MRFANLAGTLLVAASDYSYDEAGWPTGLTHAQDKTTLADYGWVYDAHGRITQFTSPDGSSDFSIDALNRLLTETNELSDTRGFTYDAVGNVESVTERTGLVKEFVYDVLYWMTSEVWKEGEITVETIGLAYDAVGRLTSISDSNSEYAYTYDALDQITEVDNTGTPPVILTSTYDALGRRATLSAEIDGTDDFLNTYTYDAVGRMIRIEQTDGARFLAMSSPTNE